MTPRPCLRALLLGVALLFAAPTALPILPILPAFAQDEPAGHADRASSGAGARGGTADTAERAGGSEERRPSADGRKLPAESVTRHALDLPGRRLEFSATAGVVPLLDGEGGPLLAEVATVAFQKEGEDARTRPVTFLFNGGPGAASGYLNLGAVGPWRVPLGDPSPSVPPVAVPNAETWLDFTDLVFIDPVGTGYSWTTARGDDARRRFYTVDGDAAALATVIRKWSERNGRQASPKILAGESYGGFRVPKVAHVLQTEQGVGVRGLVMLSPVLDFGWRFQDRHSPLRWVAELPSMAAAVREEGRGSGEGFAPDLADVERYAAGDYMVDLLRGARDESALARMSGEVARLTGLDPALVRRLGGRVDANTFLREKGRARGAVASAYDATVEAADPYPLSAVSRPDDPVLTGIEPILSAGMTELYRKLGWRVDRPYRLLNREVNGSWQWGGRRTAPQVVDDLREALALDRHLDAIVAHGASDLVTPYFENRLLLAQLPDFGPDRLRLVVYGGGHMFYTRDASRRAFRDDVERLVRGGQQAVR